MHYPLCTLLFQFYFWSPSHPSHSCLLFFALFAFWLCIRHSVAFSSLRYTAVRGQSSGWCEISHSSHRGHTSLKSQQNPPITVVTNAIARTLASKYYLEKQFQICQILLLQIQQYVTPHDAWKCIKCMSCIFLAHFISYAYVFTCFAVAGWVENPSVQTSKMMLQICSLKHVEKVNNKIHLRDKNPFCSEIIKNYNTLIPVVIKLSFWWNWVLLCFDTCSCLRKQAPCFTVSSAGNYWLWLLCCSWYQRQDRHFKAVLTLPDE